MFFRLGIDKSDLLWYNIFVRNRKMLRSSMCITKISPRMVGHPRGRFLSRLTDHFLPSSHLQSSSTNKPAMTEIIKLRSISINVTPFRINASGMTGKYIIPYYSGFVNFFVFLHLDKGFLV